MSEMNIIFDIIVSKHPIICHSLSLMSFFKQNSRNCETRDKTCDKNFFSLILCLTLCLSIYNENEFMPNLLCVLNKCILSAINNHKCFCEWLMHWKIFVTELLQ